MIRCMCLSFRVGISSTLSTCLYICWLCTPWALSRSWSLLVNSTRYQPRKALKDFRERLSRPEGDSSYVLGAPLLPFASFGFREYIKLSMTKKSYVLWRWPVSLAIWVARICGIVKGESRKKSEKFFYLLWKYFSDVEVWKRKKNIL